MIIVGKKIGKKVGKTIVGLSPATLERFVLRARRAVGLRGSVNVWLTSSRQLRLLNAQFRGKDKATDVLSFPVLAPFLPGKTLAGDLAISLDIAGENAVRLQHPLAEEIKILVLHGILHLAGFDHETDNGEMADEEDRLRRQLRLKVGLIGRASRSGGRAADGRNMGMRSPGPPLSRRSTA